MSYNPTKPDASIVIGFRDWGVERIRRSIQSIIESSIGITAEIIVSDYGSADPGPIREMADDAGVKHVYTAGDTNWSRARALNAGFAAATGRLFISTDADMLFSPSSLRRVVETADEAGKCALFLQCRDLPAHMGDEYFSDNRPIDWALLEQSSRLRPRWGMGGMMAIPADGFSVIRGFDERLHTYGGEDLDFAQRARRAGFRTVWVDEPDVRMFHMWHPPTLRTVESTESGRKAVEFNRNVVYNDLTYARNAENWQFRQQEAGPLVTVAIATRNRSEYLAEAVRSVLVQSVKDFELIVVDDGSDDDATETVLAAFEDPRIKYYRQDHSGIAAARNFALDLSSGYFTAVMDDDDIMHPRRLEWQLEAVTAGFAGSVGSFVNFDDTTGELELIVSKIPSFASAVETGGAPGHSTWLLRTDVMRTIRYDATLPSGIDNNFFLRLLRTGFKVAHCGKAVLLRRRHRGQVTAVDGRNQSDAAKQTLQLFLYELTPDDVSRLEAEAKEDAYPRIGSRQSVTTGISPFLPDGLVRRQAAVVTDARLSDIPTFEGRARHIGLTRNGEELRSWLQVDDASWNDLVLLAGIGTQLTAEVVKPDRAGPGVDISWFDEILMDCSQISTVGETIEIRRTDRPHHQSQHDVESDVYALSGISETIGLEVGHGDADVQGTRPWIVIGRTAEEYFA